MIFSAAEKILTKTKHLKVSEYTGEKIVLECENKRKYF